MPVFTTRHFITTLLLVSFSTFTVPAQQRNPEQQERQVKREIKKAYVDWVDNVAPILTEAERNAWKKLQTDEEREKFIEDFWHSRDPDPDTEENEFKEEYFERVAYANEHFSSGKPGRLTDRGRVYIKFGRPDSIESHPAGGHYERPWSEGGGSASTYPFEKWFYRHIENINSGIELEFVDPTGSGEYRLARNPNEKDALINIPNAGPTFAELTGLETRADRLASLHGFGLANYRRAQDSPFEVMNLQNDLQRDPPFKRSFVGGSILSTPITDPDAISLETQINYFRQSDGRVLALLAVQANNDDLTFTNSGGLETARLNIFGRLTSVANRPAGKFEDSVTTTATSAELSTTRARKSVYAKAFILNPGRYRMDVVVRDVESGAAGQRHVGFVVPEFPADKLAASSIILAAKLEQSESGASLGPFNIGSTKVIPNLSGVYRRNEPVGIYLQIYNAAIDQSTLRPATDVEYVLLKGEREISKHVEDWRDINDAGQRLTLARLIDSRSLEPGEYQIQIRIRDQVSGQRLTPSANFKIVP